MYNYYIRYFLGDQRPQLKDIDNFVVIKCAPNWKQLGRSLDLDDTLLNIIEMDYPYDCERCCSKMLSEWLDVTPNASWKILNNAMEKIQNEPNKLPDAVEKLDTVVNKLSSTVKEFDVAANKLPDTVKKLNSAVDKLPETGDQLCETVKLSKPIGKVLQVMLLIATYTHCIYIHSLYITTCPMYSMCIYYSM